MMLTRRTFAAVLLAVLLGACRTESDQVVFTIQAHRFANSEWSQPVNLGPLINSSAVDANAFLSADEHTVYFVSTRAGGLGLNDIWMSRRPCLRCPWETPSNLGAPVNSDSVDASPTLSEDGRLLFFFSARPGGFGGADIYVSRRVSTSATGDVWGPPTNLGAAVNTAGTENGPYYVHISGEGQASLFFNRISAGGSLDVFRVLLSHDGIPLGPAVTVAELNDPTGVDQKVTVRTDGLELLLSSIRDGGFGNFDIWSFTRASVHDPWGTPTHLPAPVNTSNLDSQPSLSRDGRTLIFTSIRTGGHGLQDLWMSTRMPSAP